MRAFVLVCLAVISCAVCMQDVAASEVRSPGEYLSCGFPAHEQSVFSSSGHGFVACGYALAAADDFDSQRKRREGEGSEDKKERKEDEKERKEDEADKDDDGGFAGACLGSIFEGLFSSDDDDDDDRSALAPEYPVSTFLYDAIVLSEPGAGVSKTLWSDLGGESSGAEPTWVVMENTMLKVHKERLYGDEKWVEVSVAESPHMTGWMRREYVQEYAPVEEERYVDIPRWQLLFSFSGGVFFNKDLFDEYKGRIWSPAGGARIFPNSMLHLMIRGSYLKAYGDPSYICYETSDATEYPRDSRLSISRLSFMAGTYHMVGGTPTQVAWAAGPCLCRVAEEAEIVIVGEGFTDLRVDKLDQYRVGVDMSLDFQWRVGESVPVFIDIGAYVIPVKRDGEKSLTVDFLDGKVIGGMTVGFGIGYSIF